MQFFFSVALGLSGFVSPFNVNAQATSTGTAKPAKDATNQSSRERDHILLQGKPGMSKADIEGNLNYQHYDDDVVMWNQALNRRMNEELRATLAFNNVLNCPERAYQGERSRVVNNLYSGSAARLSIVYSLLIVEILSRMGCHIMLGLQVSNPKKLGLHW